MDYLKNRYPMDIFSITTKTTFTVDGRTCSDYGNAILVTGSITRSPLPVDVALEETPDSDERRHLTCADADVASVRIWSCTTHLVGGDPDDPLIDLDRKKQRKRQIGQVASAVNQVFSSGRPVVMGGDFNATPMEATPPGENDYPRMLDPIYDSEGGFGNFQEVGGTRSGCGSEPSVCATYPSDFPIKKIDYLFLDVAHWFALYGQTSAPKLDGPRSDHFLLKGYAVRNV